MKLQTHGCHSLHLTNLLAACGSAESMQMAPMSIGGGTGRSEKRGRAGGQIKVGRGGGGGGGVDAQQ